MMMSSSSAVPAPPPLPLPLPPPGLGGGGGGLIQQQQQLHERLLEFAKTALIKIFASPYATVCDLYSGKGIDIHKWDDAQIANYISIDVPSSGIAQLEDDIDNHNKSYDARFYHLDPSLEPAVLVHLQQPTTPTPPSSADLVFCLQHLPFVFQSEDRARILLHNVSSMLNPGGFFLGITPDSSTIWAKYQKNVEAYHNRAATMKPNILPNCIRSDNYVITFELDEEKNVEEKFPLFGKKYQLKFANETVAETHCLVHFPSLIRSAREAGLDYIEIQNLTEFYDDNRAQLAGMLSSFGPNLVDPKGRLLPRAFDVLGLYTTFVFQKPDPDVVPPMPSPLLHENDYNHDEGDWQEMGPREDEMSGHAEPKAQGPGKVMEHKGILGPGPPDQRYSEVVSQMF